MKKKRWKRSGIGADSGKRGIAKCEHESWRWQ